MIYLIGGPPRCGKTTLARALSKKLDISYIPADYLMSVISPYIPQEEIKERLPRWYARMKTEKSNDRLYSEYSLDEIVAFYTKEAETYWPGIKNFILYALHDNHDFIIEGAQLRPDLVRSLMNEENAHSFRTAFLYKSGEKIVEGLKANTEQKDWTKNDTSEETYDKIAQMIELFGEQVKAQCTKHNLSAYDVSDNFHMQIEQIANDLKWISG